jgi:putative hydrolase of the HAD superfamily
MQNWETNQLGNRSINDLSPQELDNLLPGARHFALWLLPSEEDRNLIGEIIRDLAREFDALPFSPHLTLYQGITFNDDHLAETLERLATTLQPLDLRIRAVASSDLFYRCIFIDLIDEGNLGDITHSLMKSLQHQEPYTLDAHVSLLYKELTQEARSEVLSRIQFPGKTINFNALQVVRPGLQSKGWRDSTRWELDPAIALRDG